jgi:hypothetical protein
MRPIRPRFGVFGKHLFSVIAVKGPINGRHADMANSSGWIAGPFWFRPLMRSRSVQNLGVITPHFETDDVPTAPRRRNPC